MIMKFDFLWYKFDVLFKTQIYLFYYLIYLKNILFNKFYFYQNLKPIETRINKIFFR